MKTYLFSYIAKGLNGMLFRYQDIQICFYRNVV